MAFASHGPRFTWPITLRRVRLARAGVVDSVTLGPISDLPSSDTPALSLQPSARATAVGLSGGHDGGGGEGGGKGSTYAEFQPR